LTTADQPWLTLLQDATRSFGIRNQADAIGPIWRGFLLGLAVSAAGQIGDLFESCLKRDGGLKDSGNLIPRYGGILDLIDSPMYAMPAAWFLLTVVWNVV
jgi:CDP-diglyceride synthetase